MDLGTTDKRRGQRAWEHASESGGLPVLAEWPYRLFEHISEPGVVGSITGFTAKTVRKGGPVRQKAHDRFLAKIHASVSARFADADEATSAYMQGVLDRSSHQSFVFAPMWGVYGDTALTGLCEALDEINDGIWRRGWDPESVPERLVECAAKADAFPGVIPDPVAGERVALDATLMILARLDHVVRLAFGRATVRPQSLFLRLTPSEVKPKGFRRLPYGRFLDYLYGLDHARKHGKAPAELPSIRELDMLLGTWPESGGQSPIVRWRGGYKRLTNGHVEGFCRRVVDHPEKQWLIFPLFQAAALWDLLKDDETLPWAVRRYSQWWEAGLAGAHRGTDEPERYWLLI